MKRQPDTRPALERVVSFVDYLCITPAKRRPITAEDAHAAGRDLWRLRKLEQLHKAGATVDYAELDRALDCGNNPCHFSADGGGMRTQGQCMCIRDARPGVEHALSVYVRENRRMRAELATLREQVASMLEAENV